MSEKVYIIACESSGDYIASQVISQLKVNTEQYNFHGIGGSLTEAQGIKSLFDIKETSIMGFAEILPHIFKMKRLIKQTIQDIRAYSPDIIITIDSPGFCFRVIQQLQDLRPKVKFVHIVAPSVWAYKPERAEKISKIYDHLLCILDFEPPLFIKHGLKSTFIGHPIIEQFKNLPDKNAFRQKYNIPENEKIICLTPGSRKSEIQTLLPIFMESINLVEHALEQEGCKSGHKIRCVILVNKISKDIVEFELQKINKANQYNFNVIITEDKLLAFTGADLALAKSGTNVVEISLCKTPVIVAHKLNFISYLYIKSLALIKYVSIVNILANEEIIPELIQRKCNKFEISKHVLNMLNNHENCDLQVAKCLNILKRLNNHENIAPTVLVAKVIAKL